MHIHWGQLRGFTQTYDFLECRCGAKKTKRTRHGYTALRPGWPVAGQGWSKDHLVYSRKA